jgi:hypothetical protein
MLSGGAEGRSNLNLETALCVSRKAGGIRKILHAQQRAALGAKTLWLDIQLARAIVIMARARGSASLRKQFVNCA